MGNVNLKPGRNYGIDFLRILSMFFVLLLHILNQGGVIASSEKLSLGYNLSWFIETCAYCAVNCYALISGFIGYKSKHKYSNIINLYIQTAFYALLATGIFYLSAPDEVGEKSFIKAALPFGFNYYWYFTAYLCMFFFIPFMNKALEVCDFKQLTCLVSAIVVFFSVIPFVFKGDPFSTKNGYCVLWISLLYIIGGYIRKYELHKKISNIKCILIYFSAVVLSLGLKLLNDYPKAEFFNGDYSLIKYTSPTILICAVTLLCLFAKIELKDGVKKIVAVFSPLSFGVYLIHTAPYVWTKVMKNRFVAFAEYNPFVMIILILVTAVGIFVLCSLIDYIRIKIFNLLKIKELSAKIEGIIEKYIDKFLNKKEFEQIDS